MAGLINLLNINVFSFNNGFLTAKTIAIRVMFPFLYTADKQEHVTFINGVLVPMHF